MFATDVRSGEARDIAQGVRRVIRDDRSSAFLTPFIVIATGTEVMGVSIGPLPPAHV